MALNEVKPPVDQVVDSLVQSSVPRHPLIPTSYCANGTYRDSTFLNGPLPLTGELNAKHVLLAPLAFAVRGIALALVGVILRPPIPVRLLAVGDVQQAPALIR